MTNITNKIFLLLCIFISINTFAQPIRFSHVLGSDGYDDGYSAKQTFDKGYIVGGSTSSFGAGATDMYLLKTDPHGNPVRQRTIGGINIDIGKCVRQTADSGYIMVGYTNSFGTGGYDVYLVKTDSLLDTLWTHTYGGFNWDFGNCVEQTTDGGYIICGSTFSFGNTGEDYYLLKTDANGTEQWAQSYGGANDDVANSVIQTSDGGYILTGTTKSMGDLNGDIYTIKTNAIGDTIWTNKFGGPNLDYGNDVLESIYGGYMVGAETQNYGLGTLGNSDGVIVRLSSSGHVDSIKVTGVPGNDNIQSITEDVLGRIAMTGKHPFLNGSTSLFLIYNNWYYVNGTQFGFNNYEMGYSVETTADTGFVICGYTTSFNNFIDDIYLIKTDSFAVGGGADVLAALNIQTLYPTQNSDFKIFPNPASDFVTIYSEKINESATIKIFDVLGNELKSNKTEQKIDVSINVSDLANGIYFITISTKSISVSQKLIIQH